MATLYDRIRQTIDKLKPALPVAPTLQPITAPVDIEEPEVQETVKRLGYITEASISHTIRQAARHKLLVQVFYNNVWRYVEPYSFRQGKLGTLFFGHDLARNATRSYYLHRIHELRPTSIPFNPRWFVEIN